MKTSLLSLLVALAAALLQVQANAQDMRFASYGGPVGPEQGPPAAVPGNCPCPQCMGGQGGCEECPRISVGLQAGVDSFRGISDGSYQSNFGLVGGAFGGMPVPVIEEYGLGMQIGVTQGYYDLSGRYPTTNHRETQQQTFLTAGLFRRAHDGQRLSFGVVYDFMVNENWGVYGINPTLGQWRGQVEWMLDDCNAVGVYGALRDRSATDLSGQTTVTTRSINQVDIFWHHKFAFGADGRFWFGVPEDTRITRDGSLGAAIYGASLEMPLSDSISFYGAAQYMQPSASASAVASVEDAYNVAIGLVWYPGRNAVSSSVAGGCWTPYLPTANNSTFLVDQHPTF